MADLDIRIVPFEAYKSESTQNIRRQKKHKKRVHARHRRTTSKSLTLIAKRQDTLIFPEVKMDKTRITWTSIFVVFGFFLILISQNNLLGMSMNTYTILIVVTGVVLLLFATLRAILEYREVNMMQYTTTIIRDKIKSEKKILDDVIGDMFPKAIIPRIKAGEPIFDIYKNVTVLFTDIKNYTVWAAEQSPITVAKELNRIYSTFDEISIAYNVYKVETIGDSYMICVGAPDKETDHAQVACRFATALLSAVKTLRTNESKTPDLNIRVGIHSGPVCAGVVGIINTRFHLFGDTVNTASRMEQYGVAGKIQMSKETNALIHEQFTCDERPADVKSKGLMQLYLLKYADQIDDLYLNVLNLQDYEMKSMVAEMFRQMGVLDYLECTMKQLDQFIHDIRNNYLDIPYHNFAHAFNVTQVVYKMVIDSNLYEEFTLQEKTAIMIASLCSDIGHQGLTSTYYWGVKSHEFTRTYGTISTLENYHASMCHEIMQNYRDTVFKKLSANTFLDLKNDVKLHILATDINAHKQTIRKFEDLKPKFDIKNRNHRMFLLNMILKMADLSDDLREENVGKYWCDALYREYKGQNDKEKEHKISITNFGVGRRSIEEEHRSFVGEYVYPLFDSVREIVPVVRNHCLTLEKYCPQSFSFSA
jgi:class 3 adenylate cyclase